jgi:nucleoside-diphosphate-sugar epimerase
MTTLEFTPEIAARLKGPVIVTGAGGWLGQAALEMLAAALPLARIHAFGASARRQALRGGAVLAVQPLTALAELRVENATIFHLAFLTREHAGKMPLADYISGNRAISALVAGFIRRNGAAGLFLPSSGAVYAGAGLEDNPYGALKLEDEHLFSMLCAWLNIPAVLMRVFNLAGPFINKLNSYALACIIADIQAGGPVTLRAAHPVWRGYTHVGDALNIALGLLQQGASPPVFDSAGEAVELSALARRAGRLLGRDEVEILRPAGWEHGKPDEYLGDGSAYAAHAAATGTRLRGLDAQILETSAYMAG